MYSSDVTRGACLLCIYFGIGPVRTVLLLEHSKAGVVLITLSRPEALPQSRTYFYGCYMLFRYHRFACDGHNVTVCCPKPDNGFTSISGLPARNTVRGTLPSSLNIFFKHVSLHYNDRSRIDKIWPRLILSRSHHHDPHARLRQRLPVNAAASLSSQAAAPQITS